ncbi:hypothetical protein BTR23_11255 [Alkalihalophilus pseudofirmus]|nr:hypothetical protein BTR23_11255 [Alkalihalophilus pseudofirmus]
MQSRKLKRVIIKEEFIELTGSLNEAVILNQILYWQERVNDYDKMLSEEISRLSKNGSSPNVELSNGWIYKKAEELAEETLLRASRQTIRNALTKLVDKGYLLQRRNPKYSWDKTFQYRINYQKLISDLHEIGYALEGYDLLEKAMISNEQSNVNNLPSNENKGQLRVDTCCSEVENLQAIPETTSKVTTENLKKEQEEKDMPPNPFQFYEQNGFGMLGSYLAEKINYWLDGNFFDEPERMVIEAMKLSIENNVKAWKYAETILYDWSSKRIRTLNDVQALIARHKEQKSRNQKTSYSKSKPQQRKENLPKWMTVPEKTPSTNTASEEFQRKKKEYEEKLELLRERKKQKRLSGQI